MNFQQLRIIREAVRRDFNLTELGIELFVRRGKRLTGLTEPGKEMVSVVERMLLDALNIKRLAQQFSNRDVGQLTVVTTHTQARYALPEVVAKFKAAFPKVHLALHQGSPKEIVAMLRAGEADIGVATEALDDEADLVSFPWYEWHHAVIVPRDHALAGAGRITLTELAEQPLITYHEGFTGRGRIDRAFADAGLTPDIVMSALDADVIKTYVELGLGVGIVASMAWHPKKDEGLALLDGAGIFPANTTRIAVRRGHYLRGFAYRFIELCAADLTESAVRAALAPGKDELNLD